MTGPSASSAQDRALLEQTVAEILTDHCPPEAVAAEGSWIEPLWRALHAAGLTAVGVPEHLGGSGGEPADAAAVVRVAAAHAGPVPLAEGLFPVAAGCAAAGLAFPDGPCTVAAGPGLTVHRTGAGVVLDGSAPRVPYGRVATRILVADDGDGDRPALVALLDPAHLTLASGDNLAGEPRDDVVAAGSEVPTDQVAEVPPGTAAGLHRLGALARAVQVAGAVGEVLALTARYASEREQFGRPIGRFQAVGHQVAVLAGLAAAAGAAADAAVASLARGPEPADLALAVAAAKTRAGAAAGPAARIAHQVHGAIGFTQEHRLHHLTRRLWSWREEFGSETHWAAELGRAVVTAGADALWPTITRI